MEKVYLLFTDTGTLFTRMIKLYTKKTYNHASIAFDSNFQEMYSFVRKYPNNPFIGGFVKEDLRSALFLKSRGAVYSIWATKEQIARMKEIIKYIEAEQQNYKYNLTGLITYTFNKPSHRKNAYFCSQFVAHVLKEGANYEFHKPISLISPYDLQCLTNLQLEYEGPLFHLIMNENRMNDLYRYNVG